MQTILLFFPPKLHNCNTWYLAASLTIDGIVIILNFKWCNLFKTPTNTSQVLRNGGEPQKMVHREQMQHRNEQEPCKGHLNQKQVLLQILYDYTRTKTLCCFPTTLSFIQFFYPHNLPLKISDCIKKD